MNGIYDSVIIGAGPAGITAAVYLKRASLNAVVCEKNRAGAGAYAVTGKIENYPAFSEIDGFGLSEKFRSHALSLGVEFLNSEAVSVSHGDNVYTVSLKNSDSFPTRTVIFAAGTSYRKLDVKGNDLKGISYCAHCDGAFYKNRVTAVIGGGNTALGDALYLSEISSRVYLIHRRDSFRADRSLQEKVRGKSNITIITNASVTEIIGEKRVSGIKLSFGSGGERSIDADGIFAAIGSVPNSKMAEKIAETDKNGYIVAGEDCVTSRRGFFAAGDVRTTPLRQIVTACADGANAALSAEKYLYESF